MAEATSRGDQDRGTRQPGGGIGPAPDAALGVWASWMKGWADAPGGRDLDPADRLQWLMKPDAIAGGTLSAGVDQLRKVLAADPMLTAVDRLWNANPLHDVIPVDWGEVARALRTVWLRRMADPVRAAQTTVELGAKVWTSAVEAWNDAAARWMGLPASASQPKPGGGDKRFEAPEWHANPAYRTLKEVYLLASDFLMREADADGLDPAERERLRFHLQQFVNATSPTLLLLSNPAALRRIVETGGASLADGARNLLSDLKEGRLSMVDATAFEPGRNLATTPGKVVYRNRLIELIQYAPQTEKVRAVPLLFLPPWINKYYILDMQPKNSMVRYLVQQGFTVFVVSWKNPDASMEDVTFEDYMQDGPLAAAEVIREITGSKTVNPIGYCIGGTLLILTLAYLAARGDEAAVRHGDLHGLDAGLRQGRRDRRLHGRALDRLRRAADDGAGLSRQPRDGQHVQPAALQRPDLVQRGQQLPDGREAAGVRPAVLEQRRHADGARGAQLVPAQHLPREQPDQARPRRARWASGSTSAGSSRTSTRSGPRRTTSCRGTRRGASPSSRAARCGSSRPRAATSPAIINHPAGRKGAFWVNEASRRDARGVARGRHQARGQLVDRLDRLARRALGRRGGPAAARRRVPPAARPTRRGRTCWRSRAVGNELAESGRGCRPAARAGPGEPAAVAPAAYFRAGCTGDFRSLSRGPSDGHHGRSAGAVGSPWSPGASHANFDNCC